MFDPPIFINVRDRVRDLRRLVAWLEEAGHKRIVLLDNASTYEPLLHYLDQSPHEVRRLGNLGSRAPWIAGIVPQDEPWVYTDPDVVPIDACPKWAVKHLRNLLRAYDVPKVGMGLYLDDLPAAHRVLKWERSLVSRERQLQVGVYDSLVDTTFALYQPGVGFGLDAIRTGYPYQMRHESWYLQKPDREDRYYLEHATRGQLGSSWAEEFHS